MVKMTFFYAYWNLLLADEDNVMKFNSLKYQLQNSGENHGNDEIQLQGINDKYKAILC